MSYLVVGRREGENWSVEVQGVGKVTADSLGEIEASARRLLASYGYEDAQTADLQLLVPDFETDFDEHGMPGGRGNNWALISGLILLLVVVGALAFVVGGLV